MVILKTAVGGVRSERRMPSTAESRIIKSKTRLGRLSFAGGQAISARSEKSRGSGSSICLLHILLITEQVGVGSLNRLAEVLRIV